MFRSPSCGIPPRSWAISPTLVSWLWRLLSVLHMFLFHWSSRVRTGSIWTFPFWFIHRALHTFSTLRQAHQALFWCCRDQCWLCSIRGESYLLRLTAVSFMSIHFCTSPLGFSVHCEVFLLSLLPLTHSKIYSAVVVQKLLSLFQKFTPSTSVKRFLWSWLNVVSYVIKAIFLDLSFFVL